MAVERGNIVKLHYTAKLFEQVVETSLNGDPIEFRVGEGEVINGLDEAVVGLDKGEKKTVLVPPEKAFGQRKEGLTGKIARCKFTDAPSTLREGGVVQITTNRDEIQLATILHVEEDNVIVDLNHPLAGETIEIDVEVVDVKR